jgi:hypothetical protein
MQVYSQVGGIREIAIGILAVPDPASKIFPDIGPNAIALLAKAAFTSIKSIESYSTASS